MLYPLLTWKWLRRLVVGIVVSITITTIGLVVEREWKRSAGERELAEAFAETQRTDPDWDWDSLSAGRVIPPAGANSAELIPKIKAAIPADWRKAAESRKWLADEETRAPNHPLSQAAKNELERELGKISEAITIARSLKDHPFGNRTITLTLDVLSTTLQDTQDTRLVVWILRLDALLAASRGEGDRAADDLLAMLNSTRSIGDEPFLISQLVRCATRSIAANTTEAVLGLVALPEAKLNALLEAWSHDSEQPLFLIGLRGERAAYDTYFHNLSDGSIDPGQAGGPPPSPLTFEHYAWWLYRGRLPSERAEYHRYLTAAVAIAVLPPHEQEAAMAQLPTLPNPDRKMVSLLLPAVARVNTAFRRNLAEARCVVLALASERFCQREGPWPANLADLQKEILQAIPPDPYNGRPMGFDQFERGVTISSLSPRPVPPGNAALPKDPAAPPHVHFRLWNVNVRNAKE